MTDEDTHYICQVCAWEQVTYARARRCMNDKVLITCEKCGEAHARKATHCIVPLNKGHYMPITDLSQLKQLNPKRTA